LSSEFEEFFWAANYIMDAMCGRFTLRAPSRLQLGLFQLAELPSIPCRYNIAPSQPIAAVRAKADTSSRELAMLRWGLIPSWAKDPAIGNTLINARGESVASKPAFRSAFRSRRCLIVADGFYEWQKKDGGKQPFYIQVRGGEPFAFAGLWEHWHDPQGEIVESAAIVTTDANEIMRPIHNRMPVILAPNHYDLWLDPTMKDPKLLEPLLRPYPSEELMACPVSTYVNNPRHNDDRCIAPISPSGSGELFA
jgi:putative SOS response-associated peptidase YedK